MDDTLSREEEVFDAARKLDDPAEREAYLDRACDDDSKLRVRVEALLSVHSHAEELFTECFSALRSSADNPESPAAARDLAQGGEEEQPGAQIGHYKILQRIGEGGCGAVYTAEQEKPMRRLVALKVIKLGMDTRAVIARFDAERQALAMMDHPNIAKVLDAGATHSGRPYFVMELVRGTRITDYCDQNQLDTRDRLELFIQICHAIQHAHQKGIIHRDIKPSNIIVTLHDGLPVPKVIDFGIAKATEAPLTDKTLLTLQNQLIGTPAYMSPEQAGTGGLDIDTRSDIYSLGVLLYELLTGKTPFDSRTPDI
jgi:serine/threonine protein kinase